LVVLGPQPARSQTPSTNAVGQTQRRIDFMTDSYEKVGRQIARLVVAPLIPQDDPGTLLTAARPAHRDRDARVVLTAEGRRFGLRPIERPPLEHRESRTS
jgi:hypothetical protein